MKIFFRYDAEPRRFAHNLVRVFLLILLAGLMSALWSCKSTPPQTREIYPPSPFHGIAFRSLDDLAKAALAALNDSSFSELDVLRVVDIEYREEIWTRIPVQEKANIDVETAWNWVDRDSQKAMRRVLDDYGKQDLKFKRVYIRKETRDFPMISIKYGVRIVAEDKAGEEQDIELMNVVGEVDGWYRVIAFDV